MQVPQVGDEYIFPLLPEEKRGSLSGCQNSLACHVGNLRCLLVSRLFAAPIGRYLYVLRNRRHDRLIDGKYRDYKRL